MFDTGNCTEEGWARDNLLQSTFPNPECDLNIAGFNALVSFYFICQFSLVVFRTYYVLSRAWARKKPLIWSQYFTILTALVSAICALFIVLVPNVWGISTISATSTTTVDNVMPLLIGLQMFMFQIVTIRWCGKIARLNFRILLKQFPEMKSIISLTANKRDMALIVLLALCYVLTAAFFIVVCILYMVFPLQTMWLRLGMGLLCAFLCVTVVCSIYQMEQCCQVIISSSKNLDSLNGTHNQELQRRYARVVRKFRLQQRVMLAGGVLGAVVCLLATVGVFWNNALYLTAAGLDTFGSLGMVASLLWGGEKSCMRRCGQFSSNNNNSTESKDGGKGSRLRVGDEEDGTRPSKESSKLAVSPNDSTAPLQPIQSIVSATA